MTEGNGHGGARPGAGRKRKADEQALAELMAEAWPREQRIAVLRALATAAVAGDVKAAQLLMEHAYGKPRQAVELDQAGELRIVVEYGDDSPDPAE